MIKKHIVNREDDQPRKTAAFKRHSRNPMEESDSSGMSLGQTEYSYNIWKMKNNLKRDDKDNTVRNSRASLDRRLVQRENLKGSVSGHSSATQKVMKFASREQRNNNTPTLKSPLMAYKEDES